MAKRENRNPTGKHLGKGTWLSIREDYEAGVSNSDLARKYGVTRGAISKHKHAENWIDPRADVNVTRSVIAKIVDRDTQEELIRKEQLDWKNVSALIERCCAEVDTADPRNIKVIAETYKLLHDGLRRAHGVAELSDPRMALPSSDGVPACISELVARLKFSAEGNG